MYVKESGCVTVRGGPEKKVMVLLLISTRQGRAVKIN